MRRLRWWRMPLPWKLRWNSVLPFVLHVKRSGTLIKGCLNLERKRQSWPKCMSNVSGKLKVSPTNPKLKQKFLNCNFPKKLRKLPNFWRRRKSKKRLLPNSMYQSILLCSMQPKPECSRYSWCSIARRLNWKWRKKIAWQKSNFFIPGFSCAPSKKRQTS